jgi:pyruvate dehydrogenase (quinone)
LKDDPEEARAVASMACGLPYAIAAQIAYPERQVVAFMGDGGF